MAAADVAPTAISPSDDTSATSTTASVTRQPKVCDYYLLGRGCVKGDECDFIHPKAPDGTATSKLCDYYYQPRGCTKGDSCNFLHVPAQQLTGKYRELHPPGQSHAPGGSAAMSRSVCQFFLSPSGCKKGNQCDHLHPGFQSAPVSALSMMAGMAAGGGGGRGVCSYYLTPQGCKKGNMCDRDHVVPPGFPLSFPTPTASAFDPYGAPAYAASLPYGGTSRPPPPPSSKTHPTKAVPCPYFARPSGCKKGDACEMIHQKQEMCQFMAKYGNCKKGEWCDYLHVVAVPGMAMAAPAMRSAGYGGADRRAGRNSRYNPY